MNRYTSILAALGVLALPTVGAAHVGDVTTVSFEYPIPGIASPPAGSFSYDASKTGIIGFGDLLSFNFDDHSGEALSLTDVLAFNRDAYFAWDPKKNFFAPSPIDIRTPDNTYTGKYYVIAGANYGPGPNDLNSWLYLPADSVNPFYDFSIYNPNGRKGVVFFATGPAGLVFDSVLTAPGNIPDAPPPAAVPEPAAWATMLLGLGLTGAMIRRRGRIIHAEAV